MAFGYFDAAATPEELAVRRQQLEALAGRIGRAQNVGQGVGDMLSGLAVGIGRSGANRAERAGRAEADKAWSAFNPFASYTMPDATPGMMAGATPAAGANPAPGGAPVAPVASGGNTGAWLSSQLQKDFGLSPGAAAGFAGNLAHESGNFKTLQEIKPTVPGSRGGFGWAQWTGPRRKQFEQWAAANKVDPSSPEANYGFLKYELANTPEGAVLNRLKGVNDPAKAAQIVSNTYLRPGVPHMDSRVRYAEQIAGTGGPPPQAPVQVASLNPNFVPASAPPPGQQMQPPNSGAPEMPELPKIGQNAPSVPQQAAMAAPNNQRMADLMNLAANPWLPESKKRVVQMMLEQEMQRADPAYQMKMQSDQIGLEKSRLELQQMRNPPPPKPEYITSKDGSVLAVGPDGAKVIYGAQPEPVKPTSDMQEYELARSQGYKGSFQDYQIALKRAGASQVNIDQKAEGAFDKSLAESQAKAFDTMATEGMNAQAELAVIGQLDGLLQGQGGTLTGMSGALARYGIGGEGVSDLQAADALINKLIPSQRQPGSGSMSDRDVEMFRASLPSLWKTPQGNRIILETMRGLAQYKRAQGEIAQQVQMGVMTRQDAVKALRAIPNPLAAVTKADGGGASGNGGPQPGSVDGGYRFKGGDPSDQSNWEVVR